MSSSPKGMLEGGDQTNGNGGSRMARRDGNDGTDGLVVEDNSWAGSVVRMIESFVSEGRGCGSSNTRWTMRTPVALGATGQLEVMTRRGIRKDGKKNLCAR